MDYRKFYQQETKIDLPEKFDVHHIDLNRNNNTIQNLVALPNELHKSYHIALKEVPFFNIDLNLLLPCSLINGGNISLIYLSDVLSKYSKLNIEVQEWINYRDFLLGFIPNVSNKNYSNG